MVLPFGLGRKDHGIQVTVIFIFVEFFVVKERDSDGEEGKIENKLEIRQEEKKNKRKKH